MVLATRVFRIVPAVSATGGVRVEAQNQILQIRLKINEAALQLSSTTCKKRSPVSKSVKSEGNRCGHDPRRPRFSDSSRRGRGGHPPIIGLITSLLAQSYADPNILHSWHEQNPSGRARRSEKREAMTSLAQYLFPHWFQLETRRCAVPGGYFLQVPDIAHLARRISESVEWHGFRLSPGRVSAIFSEWQRAGYITSHQQREQLPNGEWRAAPAIRTFTKRFFSELGGQRLWNAVKKAGAKKLEKIRGYIDAQGICLRDYLRPGKAVSPRTVHQLRGSNKKFDFSAFPFTKKAKPIDRSSVAYKTALTEKLIELYAQYGPDGPPEYRWSPEEMQDNAKRIVDALFR